MSKHREASPSTQTVDFVKQLHQALRDWHEPNLLQSGILSVPAIQSMCAANGNRDVEATVRQIIVTAIDKLRPTPDGSVPIDSADPRWIDARWTKYLILAAQYLEPNYQDKTQPFWFATFHCAQATFYRRQLDAIQSLDYTLNQMALAMVPATRLGETSVAACWVQASPPMLPPMVVSRDALMDSLRQSVATVQQQALIHGKTIALHGAAGMGKTTILTALAHDEIVRAQFPDGVLWAVAGEAGRTQLLTWASALGVDQAVLATSPSRTHLKQHMFDALGSRRVLLLVDEVWSEADINAFMMAGPNCVLIFATRSTELAQQISPRYAISVGELNDAEALKMIEAFAPSAIEFEAQRVSALLQRLAGWPHALHMAAYQLGRAARNAQKRRIREKLDALLGAEGWDILQAIIATVVNDMPENAQEMLYGLSLFSPKPASFTETAAAAITQANMDAFDGVMDSGLMQLHTATGLLSAEDRYMIHQSVMDYAHVKLLERSEADVRRLQAQFANYFSEYAHAYAADHGALLIEHEHILRAAALSAEHGFDAALIKIALAIAPLLKSRGQRVDAMALLQQAYPAALRQRDIAANAQIAHELAQCCFLMDDVTSAAHWAGVVEHIAAEHPEDATVLRCLSITLDLRVRMAQLCGDDIAVEDYGHRAMRAAHRASMQYVLDRQMLVLKEIKVTDLNPPPTGDQAEQMRGLMQAEYFKWLQQAGQNYIASTDLPVAHTCLLKALACARDSGEPSLVSNTLGFLTLICCTIGEYEQSIAASTEALGAVPTETFPRNFGLASGFGALAWLHLGDIEKAARLVQNGRVMAERLQSHETSTWVNFAAACYSLACKDPHQANEYAHTALLVAERGHAEDSIATMYGMCGRTHMALGQFELAEQNLYAAHKYAYNELQREYALADLALLAEKRGCYDEAEARLRAAFDFHVQKYVRRYVPLIGLALSRTLLTLGKRDEAIVQAQDTLVYAKNIKDVRSHEICQFLDKMCGVSV